MISSCATALQTKIKLDPVPSISFDHHQAVLCLYWSGLVGWKGNYTQHKSLA